MEEVGSLMQGKKHKGRNDLHHKLITDNLLHGRRVPHTARLVEEPATDEEETWHAKQEQHIIERYEVFFKTEHTDMGIDDENHREPSHRVNILYSLFCHIYLQRYELFRNISYLCTMNERINWMDWSKFLAVALTIPCHIPQTRGDQPVTYFEVFLLACLMFNSGYLKKKRMDWRDNIRRYWHSLIIPYFIYNILFYPFWFARFYIIHGFLPTHPSVALKPIIGMFLFQANTSFSCELNPVTWFIAALLIAHLLLDISFHLKHEHLFMMILCIIGIVLYVVSKYNHFTTHYVLVGLFKSLIFYYMGYLCRQHEVFKTCNWRKDMGWFVITFILSIVLFNYHANEMYFPLHMLSYFPAVLFGLLAFIYFCKMLNTLRSDIIVNYSNGTMVFIGLHWMIVGLIRYGILKPLFHVSGEYIYTPLEAYALGLLVTLLLYPIILFFQAKMPWMLGKRR